MFTSPSRSITFDSPFSRTVIIERIDPHVHPLDELGPIRRKTSFRTYEGHLTAEGLMLRRILKKGANSFIPKVNITLREGASGTALTLHGVLPTIILRMLLIMRILFLLFLSVLLIWGDPLSSPPGLLILGVAFILLFATFPKIFFDLEFHAVEKHLRQLAGNTSVPADPPLFQVYSSHFM